MGELGEAGAAAVVVVVVVEEWWWLSYSFDLSISRRDHESAPPPLASANSRARKLVQSSCLWSFSPEVGGGGGVGGGAGGGGGGGGGGGCCMRLLSPSRLSPMLCGAVKMHGVVSGGSTSSRSMIVATASIRHSAPRR